MKNEERMIIHFYKENLACKVMDQHLSKLAKQHVETLFVKIDAEKASFLTTKLKVRAPRAHVLGAVGSGGPARSLLPGRRGG